MSNISQIMNEKIKLALEKDADLFKNASIVKSLLNLEKDVKIVDLLKNATDFSSIISYG